MAGWSLVHYAWWRNCVQINDWFQINRLDYSLAEHWLWKPHTGSCVRLHVRCISRTAADQCAAADWLQVRLWRGPGKFLTPVPKYLDLSRPTLTDEFLKVKRCAFRDLGVSAAMSGGRIQVYVCIGTEMYDCSIQKIGDELLLREESAVVTKRYEARDTIFWTATAATYVICPLVNLLSTWQHVSFWDNFLPGAGQQTELTCRLNVCDHYWFIDLDKSEPCACMSVCACVRVSARVCSDGLH